MLLTLIMLMLLTRRLSLVEYNFLGAVIHERTERPASFMRASRAARGLVCHVIAVVNNSACVRAYKDAEGALNFHWNII